MTVSTLRDSMISADQQRIVICVLAVLLLLVSVLGLWLCKRLGRAYDRLYSRQEEETIVNLTTPDHRQVRTLPRVPPPARPPAQETLEGRESPRQRP